MGVFHNFILTTTSDLDGHRIKKYYGTVTSHIVAGTGLFSDFAAGVSDIFGGRSETYQKQLISIKDEVLKRLKEEAILLGANGIVGLRVDFDEISGKGKTMFMVSAIGTAVSIEFNEEKQMSGKIERINSDNLNIELETLSYKKKFKMDKVRLAKDDWEYITENSITELFDDLFRIINDSSKDWNEAYQDSIPHLKEYVEYLKNLPDDFLNTNIYELFFAQSKIVKKLAFSLIEERDLLNFSQIKKVLSSNFLMAKKYALKTVYHCDKKYYSREDITEFEEIKSLVNDNFPEVGEKLSKKKLMSSSEVENWICPSCKKENSSEDKFCKKCGSDIRGFFEKDVNPEDVIEDIDNKLEVLNRLFK